MHTAPNNHDARRRLITQRVVINERLGAQKDRFTISGQAQQVGLLRLFAAIGKVYCPAGALGRLVCLLLPIILVIADLTSSPTSTC